MGGDAEVPDNRFTIRASERNQTRFRSLAAHYPTQNDCLEDLLNLAEEYPKLLDSAEFWQPEK